MAGLEPLVVFWTGWGIHFMVLVSFTVQVTLLLLADIRRRRDWAWLKVVIWLAYMLADTTAIYALGHMSVLCNWSPEHQLMALWAPLLLVHLGGQDNITAYAIEDNRLWLRHLQTFVLQVAAAGYVMYVSSILSHPSNLRSAAIQMFVVGVLKYGERIWALKRADSYASSSLSATSYKKQVSVSRTPDDQSSDIPGPQVRSWGVHVLAEAYSLLDVAKQMFEGPTSYVQIKNVDNKQIHEADYMLRAVEGQLSMMYDLLYTKAAVVHTRYGLCSRILISLPFTVTAIALFRGTVAEGLGYSYKRADVVITSVLLIGAVVLETMSVLRAILSKWTAVLLYGRQWRTIGDIVVRYGALVGSETYWSGHTWQHSLFELTSHSGISTGSKMAKWIRVEDWWDSNVYSWSIEVPRLAIMKVLELVSTTEDITRSQGLNALWRHVNNEQQQQLAAWMEGLKLKLEERILVWHIATHVYQEWYNEKRGTGNRNSDSDGGAIFEVGEAAVVSANYMFFLLAARPYMLPYPVSRQAYVQLCSDAVTRFRRYCDTRTLVGAILNQKENLLEGTPFKPDEGIGQQGDEETGAAAQHQPSSMDSSTLDIGCQLAAKLIHITEQAETFSGKDVLNMVLEVWAEMLYYTAYLCNENYHAKHLTNGGEMMTIITLLMIYMKNGFIRTTQAQAAGQASSSAQGATGPQP